MAPENEDANVVSEAMTETVVVQIPEDGGLGGEEVEDGSGTQQYIIVANTTGPPQMMQVEVSKEQE